MTTHVPLPDGEMFAVSDRTILVDSVETVAAAGFVIGEEGSTLQLHLTATGRRPRTQEPVDVTLVFSIEDAADALLGSILHTLEAVAKCSEPHVCPECTAGKHRNCTSEAWCNRHDRITTCDCASSAEHLEATV
jgi:hypothetical protein